MGYLNPLLDLPAGRALMELAPEQREAMAAVWRELRTDADTRAEDAWRRRAAGTAAYWRMVATYARHMAHALATGAAEGAAMNPRQFFLELGGDDAGELDGPES